MHYILEQVIHEEWTVATNPITHIFPYMPSNSCVSVKFVVWLNMEPSFGNRFWDICQYLHFYIISIDVFHATRSKWNLASWKGFARDSFQCYLVFGFLLNGNSYFKILLFLFENISKVSYCGRKKLFRRFVKMQGKR